MSVQFNQMTVRSSYMVDCTAKGLHEQMTAVLQMIEASIDYKLLGVSVTTRRGGIGDAWHGHIFYRSTNGVLRHGL